MNFKYLSVQKMTKSVWVIFLLFSTISAIGQMSIKEIKSREYGSPESRTSQIDSMMQIGLSLESAQMPLIHTINFHYSKRVENEVVKQDIGDWTRYRRMMKIQNDKDKELKEILTKGQFEKYAEKRDEMFWEGVKSFF